MDLKWLKTKQAPQPFHEQRKCVYAHMHTFGITVEELL